MSILSDVTKGFFYYFCSMLKLRFRNRYFLLTLTFLFSVSLSLAQENIVIYESKNDSIDISMNFYDFSDSLLYIFSDTTYFTLWDTSKVHNVESEWEVLGDSVVLPLLLTPQQRYVHPVMGPVTSKFGPRRGRYHYGTDVNLNDGDTVVAAFDGFIRFTGYAGGYGNVVVIRHFNGLETLYAHLQRIDVQVDRLVFAGDVVGLGGRTGRSYGAHLHYEIRFRGVALNPQDIVDFEKFELKSDTLVLYQKNFASVKRSSSSGTVASGVPQYHTVRSGDTLGHIAHRYGTTVSTLCSLNNIRRDSILRIGQRIRVR
jgi:murein DD-endopeptidase MepM/ murein hydrolase activator NlpD